MDPRSIWHWVFTITPTCRWGRSASCTGRASRRRTGLISWCAANPATLPIPTPPSVAAVRRQCGDVISEFEPSLGGEDFALMADLVPAFQLRVGSSQPGRSDRLHNSAYQPDERCIGLGVQALSRAALELLA